MEPFLTIVTPTFNSEKTIRNTVESIINQGYLDFEYIVVDGLSTDKTMDIVMEYKRIMGDKLRIVREKDTGIYNAMNKGIRCARGKYIAIINSDDWYEENIFNEIIPILKKNHSCVLYGEMRIWDKEMESQIVFYNHDFLENRMINHPTCFVSKNIYIKYGLYNEEYKIAADYEFMLRIKNKDDNVFLPYYGIISNFRYGGASHSYDCWKENLIIKYKYGIISNNEYILRRIKLFCSEKIHKMLQHEYIR